MENKVKLSEKEMDSLIKESIRFVLSKNPEFKPTDNLVLSVYNILNAIFIKNYKYVFLEAPTGSGKSVIGYVLHFCYTYINNKLNQNNNEDKISLPRNTYILTSSKMLQEQLDFDITQFKLDNYLSMIKGIKNYECTKLTNETNIYHTYAERYCAGMDTKQKELLACYDTCPYIQKRFETSSKDCSILNYNYFLNVLQNENSPYFNVRNLTICDEAHLIPDIVLAMFNVEIQINSVYKINELLNNVHTNFPTLSHKIFDIRELVNKLFYYHKLDKLSFDDFKNYIELMIEVKKLIIDLSLYFTENHSIQVYLGLFGKDMDKLDADLKTLEFRNIYFNNLIERPNDIFIETIKNNSGSYINNDLVQTYNHKLYDLSESELCRREFLSKIDVGIFLSATLGNIEEFATLMGLEKNEYFGFRLESNFDFTKSPIFLVNSGYLNYTNFNKNIDKVLLDTLRICENFHPNEKGIIHTVTFQISQMLQQRINSNFGGVTDKNRYLFYNNSAEKEICINKIKNENDKPYIIVGPSLYEGIDLKNDQGRFNIIIKTPYSGLTDYLRKKIERFPFWYERQTIQKIVQAIGRTNRTKDDYSKVYIMDSTMDKIIFKAQKFIVDRISYMKRF